LITKIIGAIAMVDEQETVGNDQLGQDRGRGQANRRYEVLHSEDCAWLIEDRTGETRPVHGYLSVADVQAVGLDHAFQLVNSLETPRHAHPVVEAFVNPRRATSVGDVIIDPEGRAYRVEEHGFSEFQGLSRPGFEQAAANPRQQWYDDGLGALGLPGYTWEDRSARDKLSYLAGFAGVYEVSFERFADAARQMLGMAPGQEFTAEHAGYAKEEFDGAQEKQARRRADRQRRAAMVAAGHESRRRRRRI
jgi:hypothetical protein